MIAEAFDHLSSVVTVTRKWFIRRQILEGPAITYRNFPLPEDSAVNRAILHLRHSLGQRTQFKVFISALTRHSATTRYTAMRKCTVTVNTSTPEQAELAIEAILSFAASLDGKWLAPAEPAQSSQVVDSSLPTQSASDSQAISTQSAQTASVTQEQDAKAIGDASQVTEPQEFSGS